MMRQKGPLKHLDLKTTDAKMLDLGSSSKLGFRCISQLLFFSRPPFGTNTRILPAPRICLLHAQIANAHGARSHHW